MSYLALDWGTVRVGAAISDQGGKIAFPLDHILETKNAVEEIKNISSELQVEKIIVGLPTSLKGDKTESTDKTLKFIEHLKAEHCLTIELFDERFRSVEAGKILSNDVMKEKDQREFKDNIASQLMLQQYLDTKNN